nr:reverse transcriptase domain-containing protein [Tanacetum cinerariifolium]
MRSRSSSNLVGETSVNLKRRNRRSSKQRIEPFSLKETPVVMMADQRTMAELLQAPTKGYGDAIVIPTILAKNFKLKHGLLNLLTSKQFYGFKKEDPHAHFVGLTRLLPRLKLHQLDTFYNALTSADPDSFNTAAGGNLLTKTPRDALTIIENESKVHNSRNKPVVTKKSSPPASVKAVKEICVTCGGPHPYHQCLATDGNIFLEY